MYFHFEAEFYYTTHLCLKNGRTMTEQGYEDELETISVDIVIRVTTL